jgi:uncharacterized protein (DUF983 family)
MSGAGGARRFTPDKRLDYNTPKTVSAALGGLCPRCGAQTLFNSIVAFAPHCASCQFNFEQFNVGDGPAAFLTMIVGTIITLCAVIVELSFSPPFWVHVMLWLPLTLALVLGLLRTAKAALLVIEYRNRAREGRLVEPQ